MERPAVSHEQGVLQGEAVFEPIQQRVSRAHAQPQVLGGLQAESRGGPLPYFEIAYDPTSTDQIRRYSFWRRILSGGKQFFIPNLLYSSLAGEQASEVEQTSSSTAHARSELLGLLPATFVGSLPRAHRPDMRYQLELFPDQAFFLRITYLINRNSLSFDDLGSWAVVSERRLLVLWSGRKAPLTLAVKDGNTLRTMDSQGPEVASSVDYDLRRAPSLEPLEPRVAMRGMYKHFAGSGRFTECLTGRTWTVSRENDNAALFLAYAKARRRPGDEVLASLFGRVTARPAMEGEEQQPTLVVERFMGISPDETCGVQLSTPSLGNTYWKLARLGATLVSEDLPQGQFHLILHAESQRVSGSVACNRLMGRYDLKGDRLAFDQLAVTRMNCLQGTGLERAFVDALGRVKSWKITGQRLDLFDETGKLLASLEARHMK